MPINLIIHNYYNLFSLSFILCSLELSSHLKQSKQLLDIVLISGNADVIDIATGEGVLQLPLTVHPVAAVSLTKTLRASIDILLETSLCVHHLHQTDIR